jgi:hypothetical protein
MVGIGVSVGLAGAGVIGGLLVWSLKRNIGALDKKLDELADEVAKLRAENSALREHAVTDAECVSCRRECRDGFTAWMARLEGKMDHLLLIGANMNNGLGGVRP